MTVSDTPIRWSPADGGDGSTRGLAVVFAFVLGAELANAVGVGVDGAPLVEEAVDGGVVGGPPSVDTVDVVPRSDGATVEPVSGVDEDRPSAAAPQPAAVNTTDTIAALANVLVSTPQTVLNE